MIERAPFIETAHNTKRTPYWSFGVYLVLIAGIFISGSALYLNTPPDTFPSATSVTIPEGSSIDSIGSLLGESGYIRSHLLFKILVRSQYTAPRIQAGSYHFDTPLTTHALIHELVTRTPEIPLKAITFPEGFSAHNMRTYVGDTFGPIDTASVVPLEGYLFPETYYVSTTEAFSTLTDRMQREYEDKIAPLREKMVARGFTEKDVIILASIVEREANDETSMRMVAGILENRLHADLPLQVDAVFAYILGKTSAELTAEDLTMDSPYNTYENKGLPPAPISNPGLMAINAVLDPIPSDNLFYLTGTDGAFHYAKTFEEHKRNKERFLK